MTPLDTLFEDYGAYHRTAGNKLCHRFGIPLIMFSLFGMLALIRFSDGIPHLNAATLLIALSAVYYIRLDVRLGLLMLGVSAAMYLLSLLLPFWLLLTLFVLGWILQGIGHSVYERRAPAFTRNLVHLLVGPLWIASDVVGWPRRVGAGTDASAGEPLR